MKFSVIPAILFSFVLAGCGPIQVTPQGATVDFVREEPQGCKLLGKATGSQENSFRGSLSEGDLLQGAKSGLRNKAADMGGNVVYGLSVTNASAVHGGPISSSAVGLVYSCPQR